MRLGIDYCWNRVKNSYPKILENLLNKKNYNCEVLNFGFSGKALNFLEKLLVNEASKFNPNFVILTNNRNSTMYDLHNKFRCLRCN